MEDGLGDLIADLLGELDFLDELAGLFQQEIAVEQDGQAPISHVGDVPTNESHSRLTLDEPSRRIEAEKENITHDFPEQHAK